MRIIFVILFFISLKSHGQIINASQPYRPQVASCSYLLDQYSGAAAAYSLRKLDCDYSGSAIRVRRSSDNTEQDIGFVNSNLDTASLKTFVGTGGTDDGFVVKWYDQSGNALNATQSTSGNQPLIMDNGVILRDGGLPCITGDGSDDMINFSPTISSNLIYVFSVAKRQSGGYAEGRIIGFSLGDSYDWHSTTGWAAVTVSTSSDTAYTYRYYSNIASVSVTIGTRYLYYAYLNGSGGGIATNNNSPTTGSTSSTSVNITKAGIFAAPWEATGGNFKGNIQEVIVYTSDQSSNRSSINSNINTYYSIY